MPTSGERNIIVKQPLIFKIMMQIETQMNQLRLRGMARSWQAMVETPGRGG
jgi:hypothetical protein